MWVVTRKEVIQSAPARWWNQYKGYKDRGDKFDKAPITRKLLELPKPYKEEEINAIIGNDSWTTVSCYECGSKVDAVACFDVNAGEYVIELCKSCLQSAINEINMNTEETP